MRGPGGSGEGTWRVWLGDLEGLVRDLEGLVRGPGGSG